MGFHLKELFFSLLYEQRILGLELRDSGLEEVRGSWRQVVWRSGELLCVFSWGSDSCGNIFFIGQAERLRGDHCSVFACCWLLIGVRNHNVLSQLAQRLYRFLHRRWISAIGSVWWLLFSYYWSLGIGTHNRSRFGCLFVLKYVRRVKSTLLDRKVVESFSLVVHYEGLG